MGNDSSPKDLTSLLDLPKPDAPDADSLGISEPIQEEPLNESFLDQELSGVAEEGSFSQEGFSSLELTEPEDVLATLPPLESMLPQESEPSAPPSSADGPAPSTIDAIRDYSDQVAPAESTPATASTPFSLLIEGPLKVHEKERLLEILQRENIGIREVELEPQFAAGRILIPRISEYAGVILVQALRNSRAQMRLGPSDQIFRRSNEEASRNTAQGPALYLDDQDQRVAEMPVTTDQTFENAKSLQVIDTLHGSMLVKAALVMESRASILDESIEKLKMQMKLQARFRGANGIVAFKTELLGNPEQTHYTLIARGVAVRTT